MKPEWDKLIIYSLMVLYDRAEPSDKKWRTDVKSVIEEFIKQQKNE